MSIEPVDFKVRRISSPGASAAGAKLREAFVNGLAHVAARGATLVAAGNSEPPALLIQRGMAYRALSMPDGRRAIIDIYIPGDIVGIDDAVLGRVNHDTVAAGKLGYRMLSAAAFGALLVDPDVAACAVRLMGEGRRRTDRHMAAVTRLDAHGRMAGFMLGIYDRLRRRELIHGRSFSLPLTQDQLGDHLGMTMVHVSRTLRRMRESGLLLVDRQMIIILDVEALRRAANGLADTLKPYPADRGFA